ncbi:MAG: hypothetical protein FWF30_02240 [Coriobacteriia bacterium]|nr:hypothetical protein [Coriobacteriia bacterium]
MTKVTINPGVCGFVTKVEAVAEDGVNATLTVQTDCKSVRKMIDELGSTYSGYDVCLRKPGTGVFYEYAANNQYDQHCACAVISGIIKCIEAECQLALPRDVSVTFEK